MNRKQTELALARIARSRAEVHGLSIVSTQNSENGLWDCKDFTKWNYTMGEYLTKKYGKLEETHFTSVPMEQYDLRKDFKVSLKYKFGEPQICMGTQWGDDGFACVTFSARDKENDRDYEMSECQIFNESGIKYFNVIMKSWRDIRKEYGEDPYDWKG